MQTNGLCKLLKEQVGQSNFGLLKILFFSQFSGQGGYPLVGESARID